MHSAKWIVRSCAKPSTITTLPEKPRTFGQLCQDWKGRFGFHNFRHSLATALVKLKVDPKTVQGMQRHEDFGTTMELYAQSDMESMRDAQGKFLELPIGDEVHLLTERVQ
jgi:integrase